MANIEYYRNPRVPIKERYEVALRHIDNLTLQLRNKDNVIKSIVKKLKLEKPFDTFAHNLARMNLDDLLLLESKIK